MKFRLATYNVENLFSRPRALMQETSAESREILNDITTLSELIAREPYSVADKERMAELIKKHRVETKPSERPFYIQQVRNKLYKRIRGDKVEIVATGRESWDGWVELEKDDISSKAIANTARVIGFVDADILSLVEVENRTTLQFFLDKVVHKNNFVAPGRRYGHNLLIDGNDPRGIDLALLSRFPIRQVRSHIDDQIGKSRIFSRDCPEYEVELPDGKRLAFLPNHFKSKGYGSQTVNNERRRRQAKRVGEILTKEYDLSSDLVVVAGDFNDTPDSAPLQPLLTMPWLTDALNKLSPDEDRWTYRAPKHQIDFLLLSKKLAAGVQAVGIERRGIFHKTGFGGKYPHFAEVTSDKDAASDHGAVWADIEI